MNGESEFVGSDKTTSASEINKALRKKMSYQISLKAIKKLDGKILATYSLDKKPTDETINVALVEKDVGNEVTLGENAGRKLVYRNVVRSFTTLLAQREGTIEIIIPKEARRVSMILFLQNKKWRVLGAIGKDF